MWDSNCIIDVIFDNVGFELYMDFFYVLYFFESGFVMDVVMYVKCFLWFVSDVLLVDIDFLLDYFEFFDFFLNC